MTSFTFWDFRTFVMKTALKEQVEIPDLLRRGRKFKAFGEVTSSRMLDLATAMEDELMEQFPAMRYISMDDYAELERLDQLYKRYCLAIGVKPDHKRRRKHLNATVSAA